MAAKADTNTLVASTVSTFTLTDVSASHVDVTVHTSAVVYVRLDGVDPVAAADENYPVVGPGFKRFRMPHGGVVKCISAGTPVVTVSAVA
jgi:hypothetical protein